MIYLDIETLAQDPYEWLVKDDPADIKVPRNIKDPEKIAAHRQAAFDSQVADLRERSSLDPSIGGIVACVGVAVGNADPVVLVNATSDEAGERALLIKIAAGLTKGDRAGMPVASWNGAKFDWRFLAVRAMRHGVYALSRRMASLRPWGDRLHVDPAERYRMGLSISECLWSLDGVCQLLGIDVADTISGSQVAQAWGTEAGRQSVIDHCRADVVRLRGVVAHLAAAGLLQTEEDVAAPVLPPLRGSAEDLAHRAHRRQITRTPAEVQVAWSVASTDPLPPTRADLMVQPVDVLRAYLVALGGRP